MIVDDDSSRGPRAMAEDITDNIVTLREKTAAAECPQEEKRLRGLVRLNRQLLVWCRTRAGY